MYNYFKKLMDVICITTLETTILAIYTDYNNQCHIICSPGGTFKLNCHLTVASGVSVELIIKNNNVIQINKLNKKIFCGYVKNITIPHDEDLPDDFYYELHCTTNISSLSIKTYVVKMQKSRYCMQNYY